MTKVERRYITVETLDATLQAYRTVSIVDKANKTLTERDKWRPAYKGKPIITPRAGGLAYIDAGTPGLVDRFLNRPAKPRRSRLLTLD